jgi:PIN domain nuclease of toxin-antitoxin system
MQIKLQLGKLQVARPVQDLVTNQQRPNGVRVLPVILDQVLALRDLPAQHSDRFDRLRIARATAEKSAILSHDRVFTKYPVTVLT